MLACCNVACRSSCRVRRRYMYGTACWSRKAAPSSKSIFARTNCLCMIEGTKRHKDVVLNHSGRLAAYPVLVVEKSIIIYYVAS